MQNIDTLIFFFLILLYGMGITTIVIQLMSYFVKGLVLSLSSNFFPKFYVDYGLPHTFLGTVSVKRWEWFGHVRIRLRDSLKRKANQI